MGRSRCPCPHPSRRPPPPSNARGNARPWRARHQQVWALHHQGWTAPAIAQQVGLGLRTVQRDLRSTTFAGRKRRSDRGDSVLNPYKPYLLERWNAGCYNAMRLLRDLRQQGYAGGYGIVAAYAAGCGRPRARRQDTAAHGSPWPWPSQRARP